MDILDNYSKHISISKNGVQYNFPNGYTVSVVGGEGLYGDGISSFEIGVWSKNTNTSVFGWQNAEDIITYLSIFSKMESTQTNED